MQHRTSPDDAWRYTWPCLILKYLPQPSTRIKLVMRAFVPFSNAQSNQLNQPIHIALVLGAFTCACVCALRLTSTAILGAKFECGARVLQFSILFCAFKCCAPCPQSVQCRAIRHAADCNSRCCRLHRKLRVALTTPPQCSLVAIPRSCHRILARRIMTGHWLCILLVLVSSVLILLGHAILAHATQEPNATT